MLFDFAQLGQTQQEALIKARNSYFEADREYRKAYNRINLPPQCTTPKQRKIDMHNFHKALDKRKKKQVKYYNLCHRYMITPEEPKYYF